MNTRTDDKKRLDAYLASDEYKQHRVEQDERNKRLIFNFYNYQLKDKIKEMLEHDKLKFTREAFEKTRSICSRVRSILGLDYEVSLYLLNTKEKHEPEDLVVRDVYINKGQTVGDADVYVPSLGVFESCQDVKQDHYIVGWAHSHGSLPIFHSGIDDLNMQMMTLYQGLDRDIELDLIPEAAITRSVKISYSVVFNAENDDEIAYLSLFYRPFGVKKINNDCFSLHDIDIEIIDEVNGIINDQDNIDKQIRDRVSPNKR